MTDLAHARAVTRAVAAPVSPIVVVENLATSSTITGQSALIGLVPQELTTDAFESVWNTVSFSRGLFGKPANSGYVEKLLRELSLWDRKDRFGLGGSPAVRSGM